MFNKTKEAVEIAKESVFFDLRRLRRRAFDRFMEVSGGFQQMSTRAASGPARPPLDQQTQDVLDWTDEESGKEFMDGPPGFGPVDPVGSARRSALAGGANLIRSSRMAIMDAYFDRYGQQDDKDYHHISMELMVEEMRSHGFPLPIDDICDPEGQGYGNFPTDGIFHQGED